MDSQNHHAAYDNDDHGNVFTSRRPREQRAQGGAEQASLEDLRCEWRRLYRSEPPRISRDLLLRGIAYRRQELEHGGSARRRAGSSRPWRRCYATLIVWLQTLALP
jgi:hypothetical protein